ncbi:MAG: 3-deoxy-manno-octulosonate cytidylyltransferase [Pseudomonadales bacterium]|nr:3-deoxy-manno-octulosonate cytidylyltransferase [Pseudomonadales bacterium]
MTTFRVVVPARLGSSRLPNKPLLDLCGKPMIARVAERALASGADEVVVAAASESILNAVAHLPVRTFLSRRVHATGSDRVLEAAQILDWSDHTIVVNLQGDEPLIPPAAIDQVAELVRESGLRSVGTLAERMSSREDILDPHVVKVVTARDATALYFSRAPIPWDTNRFPDDAPRSWTPGFRRHIGLYAYSVHLLRTFVELSRGTLEQMESLEQLRLLENGIPVIVADACEPVPPGVDTEKGAELVRRALA